MADPPAAPERVADQLTIDRYTHRLLLQVVTSSLHSDWWQTHEPTPAALVNALLEGGEP